MRTTLTAKLNLTTTPDQFQALRTKRRKHRRRGKQAVPVSAKARKANRQASQWAFAELQACLTYQAQVSGSVCVKVDADYTSQSCPWCGFTSKRNRQGAGLLFGCRQCYYTLHADLVGACNICLRALCIRQDWVHTGQLSDAPDVTDKEDIRCTPVPVCRIAVESGHKLIPF
jgi:putative transposase